MAIPGVSPHAASDPREGNGTLVTGGSAAHVPCCAESLRQQGRPLRGDSYGTTGSRALIQDQEQICESWGFAVSHICQQRADVGHPALYHVLDSNCLQNHEYRPCYAQQQRNGNEFVLSFADLGHIEDLPR